ncbi:MAG: hypothetical protein ABI569_02915 [Casimicrobiaceae bacterium]
MTDAHRHSHPQSAIAGAMAARVHGVRTLDRPPAMGRGISQ